MSVFFIGNMSGFVKLTESIGRKLSKTLKDYLVLLEFRVEIFGKLYVSNKNRKLKIKSNIINYGRHSGFNHMSPNPLSDTESVLLTVFNVQDHLAILGNSCVRAISSRISHTE